MEETWKTREQVLQALEREHANFLAALDGIPEDAVTTQQITEQGTIKDLLGHVAMWMNVASKFIGEFHAEGVPKRLGLTDDAALNAYNARGLESRRNLPLAQVRAEFDAAYRDLVTAVQTLTDAQLDAPLPEPWKSPWTLERLIAVNSYEHEPEHTEQIIKWRAEGHA